MSRHICPECRLEVAAPRLAEPSGIVCHTCRRVSGVRRELRSTIDEILLSARVMLLVSLVAAGTAVPMVATEMSSSRSLVVSMFLVAFGLAGLVAGLALPWVRSPRRWLPPIILGAIVGGLAGTYAESLPGSLGGSSVLLCLTVVLALTGREIALSRAGKTPGAPPPDSDEGALSCPTDPSHEVSPWTGHCPSCGAKMVA